MKFRLIAVACWLISVLSVNLTFAADQADNNSLHTGKPVKYIFLLIGDGMGGAQRAAAERAINSGSEDNSKQLAMNSMPVKGITRTSSYGGKVTDSAAAATAIACGHKTKNGTLGLDAEGNKVDSIAVEARKNGLKIGIISSVPLNHATPAGFYAHRASRGMYNDIILDMADSGFDYFGGCSLIIKGKDKQEMLIPLKNNGYMLIKDPNKDTKLEKNKKYFVYRDMEYVIEKPENAGFTLADFTRLGIKHLYDPAGKGFFMMIEGGRIDWACHVNRFGAAVFEVLDLDDVVKAVLEFYKQHPEETVVIVTADHETGGLSLEKNKINLSLLRAISKHKDYSAFKKSVEKYIKSEKSFKEVMVLAGCFWNLKTVSEDEQNILRAAWDNALKQRESNSAKAADRFTDKIEDLAVRQSGFKWSTTGHTDTPVETTAIGAGANIFSGNYENTELSRKVKSLFRPQEK